jgi:superfamily II DNA/RNA helicase
MPQQFKRKRNRDGGPAWLSSVLPGGPQYCSLPLVFLLQYLQGTVVSQIPGLSVFWSWNFVTAVPSFAHISRRFDHALAAQKSTHHEHESHGPESVATSDLPENTPLPAFSTLRMKVNPDTLRAITDKPFNHAQMSSVQAAVLPLLPELARPYDGHQSHGPPRDLLVKAKTGTGKTLAFLVPAIEARIKAIDKAGVDALEKNGGQPDARVVESAKRTHSQKTVGTVVISPTRELATQIAHEATKLTHWHKGFGVKIFTGGSSKGLQLREFKFGRNDIVVATPGRIRDVLENDPDVAEVLRTATHVRACYIQ